MKKLFLILFLGIIVASCGGGETATPTEIVTETETTETETIEEDLTIEKEITYFDNVFQNETNGGYSSHIYLTKDMKCFEIVNCSGGVRGCATGSGTYSIKDNFVEIEMDGDSYSYNTKLEIRKNGNKILLNEPSDDEYSMKFKLVENDKELIEEFTSIFGSKITESSQNSSTTVDIPNDAKFISGAWSFDGTHPDFGSAIFTLSFDNSGIFALDANTGYGPEIIMMYGEYYIKGNTVYVLEGNKYTAAMTITSKGDIIFGEKKFRNYRRRYIIN